MKPLRISFVGTGNVSWHLSDALFQAGHHIQEFAGRNLEQAEIYARRVEAEPLGSSALLSAQVDLIFLCISDGAIASVAQQIPKGPAALVHCSGAQPLLQMPDRPTGVFYPLQTIRREKRLHWPSLPLFVEGSDMECTALLFDLASQLSQEVAMLQSEERKKLHLAGVFASNFVNFSWLLARDLCHKAGVDPELMHPLMEETLAKCLELGPEDAMTGPAYRNDIPSLEAHRALLSEQPGLLEVYNALSKAIQQRFSNTSDYGS